MMTLVDVNFDRSEMLLHIHNGKSVVKQQISSEQINSIQFGKETVKSLFMKKTLPKVEIHLKGKDDPLILQSGKNKQSGEQAHSIIRLFAEKNDVPLEG
ncbi:hypothetical protein [Gorillibacterium sp. sgz5001074]|uniref:hypothetical protein n=1 Tax=Gorillibacterium sp. sgz5001074 TaxID=3446695 RepID=UPI003F66D055